MSDKDEKFDLWWQREGPWVEPPNQRRGGESGVQILAPLTADGPPLYSKRQKGHIYRTLLHPFGRPTVLRERLASRALARLGIKVPNLVYCDARRRQGQWFALLVTEALVDFVSLDRWYAEGFADACPAAQRAEVLRQIGRMIARLHGAHWQHGCCYPKHVFVRTDAGGAVEVALIDLEKCRRVLRIAHATRIDFGQLSGPRSNIPAADIAQIRAAYDAALPGR